MKKKIICILMAIGFLTLLTPSVNAGIVGDIFWSPVVPRVGDNVTFYDTSFGTEGTEIEKSAWDWENDNEIDEYGKEVYHKFYYSGYKTIRHYVWNSDGHWVSFTAVLYVEPRPLFNIKGLIRDAWDNEDGIGVYVNPFFLIGKNPDNTFGYINFLPGTILLIPPLGENLCAEDLLSNPRSIFGLYIISDIEAYIV